MIIKQLYKPGFKIPIANKIYRTLTKIIIFIFRIENNYLFRNVFQQYLTSKIPINVDGIKLFFKDGNERLYLFLKTMFVLEKDIIQWINSFTSDDIFFDIGAREGVFSVYAAKKNIKTYSFEPHFSNLDALQYNILLNQLDNIVTVIPNALGSKSGKTIFSLRDLTAGSAKNEISHSKSIYNNAINKSALNLNTINLSLSDCMKLSNIPQPTKVKIDVDGAEYPILLGFGEVLSSIDELAIEIYEDALDFQKCFNDSKNKSHINTNEIKNNYSLKLNNNKKKNPYFDEIESLLFKYKFKKKSEYNNNIIYKRSI